MSHSSEFPSGFEPHEAPTLRYRRSPARPGPADLLVLVADDDADVRAIYCASIYNLGFRVSGCSDGQEAIATAFRLRPDAVLMDMSMPALDGAEATRSLKEHLPGTFVIAMTGMGERWFGQARASGCDAFLCKPFNPYVLEEILEALRRRKDGEVVKRCACGRGFTRRAWKALPCVGSMEEAELRNCPCGSSLALGAR